MDNMNNTNPQIMINGERTFEVYFDDKDDRGYVLVKDVEYKKSKGTYIPLYVIENFSISNKD